MSAFVLWVMVAGASPDLLSPVSIGRLQLKAPTRWAETREEGTSRSWYSGAHGNEDAKLSVSTFPVEPMRPATDCLKQLVSALQTDNPQWSEAKTLVVGLGPASRLVEHEPVGEASADGKVETVTTTTLVGCDGRTKWVLTYAAKTSKGTRYGAVLKRIIESIKYQRR